MAEIKDVALYGGAFNPFTLSHLVVGMAVRCATGFPVWYLPCFGHKFGKKMASPDTRMEMVSSSLSHAHLSYEDDLRIDEKDYWCCPFEIDIKNKGSTFKLMEKMREAYPNHRFHLVMGSDNAQIIYTQWDRGHELAELHPLIVVMRPGHEQLSLDTPHQIIALNFPGASSTQVREWVKTGQYDLAKRHVHDRVWLEIQDVPLYGYDPKKDTEYR